MASKALIENCLRNSELPPMVPSFWDNVRATIAPLGAFLRSKVRGEAENFWCSAASTLLEPKDRHYSEVRNASFLTST